MWNDLGRFAILVGIILFSSCSKDKGPGYQEPYIPSQRIMDLSPILSDDELLDLVQENTFNYFWDFAEPVSGLARERSQADAYGGQWPDIVTTGGSGFGLASFPAAVEHGWITRDEALQRLDKILNFLETVPTYHGVYSHWYLGSTAQTRPFGDYDDGGDLVETAFLMQGLLICRQYFSDQEDIVSRITNIWENVEWSWYTNDQNALFWHWSPNYGFRINMRVKGWNEALIVYVLAASSPTYPVNKEIYTQGWASNGSIVTNRSYYGIDMPLGPAYGGPLFFSHYSFLGLDPRHLQDQYANYWEQNTAHTLINYEYCVRNPEGFKGYGEDAWGLTASDNYQGYSAHSPTNDLGVITPTAALSSFPYTPQKSMKALRHFYEDLNADLWGEYGFYDAYSEEHNWFSNAYLAIDQGPIVAMIENYRTQLLWNLFMSDPEIQHGLDKLGFTY